MDLKNLKVAEIERGINKDLLDNNHEHGKLTETASLLSDIYGFMICYQLDSIDLQSYVEGNNTFSKEHIDAVLKCCI